MKKVKLSLSRFVLHIFVLFISISAFSSNQTIFLSGFDNLDGFQNETNLGYKTNVELNRDVFAAVGAGDWKVIPKDLQTQLRSAGDIDAIFHKSSQKLNANNGDTTLIFIDDHGYPAKDPNNLKTGGFNLDSPDRKAFLPNPPELSFAELEDIIKKNYPNQKIKIVCKSCYCGGIHEIAMSMNNVCAATAVDSNSPIKIPDWSSSAYSQSFWISLAAAHKYGDEPGNLRTAHYQGLISNGKDNDYRGILSSEAYVDKILKQGQYDPQAIEDTASNRNWKKYFTASFSQTLPLGFKSEFNDPKPCDATTVFGKQLSDITNVLKDISVQAQLSPSFDSKDFSPRVKSDFIKLTKEFQSWVSQLSDGSKQAFQNRSFTHYTSLENDSYKIYLKAQQDEMVKYYMLFKRYDSISKFLRVATPEQKRKYQSLAQCESEPL